MAQVTPNEILQISAGMEAIYQETVDDLLINIAHHFNITGWERTRFWEIKKLSELGALTEESVAIIAKHTQRAPEEIRAEFLEVAQKACKDLDPQLKKAAAEGLLQDPATDVTTSPAMRAMLTEYEAQAIDKLNMVNTTMLESTRAAFVNTVQDITRTEAQLAEAQGILNAEAGAAATHVKTHTQATQSALKKLSQTGITGFVDRAGRNWTPEAYVAMDIRTTAHNVAVNSVRTRGQEYGTDLFQVSAHPAARPLCYPWQNKILSWGASGGTFTDGDGRKRTYQSINETSYGQPAGLFGINCTHFPLVVIPGMTVPHDMPEQDPEENAKAYAESQQQRAIERDIRAAKRDLEMAKAAGLPTEDADKRVKDAQAHMRQFIKDTGRTRQYSREKIGPTAAKAGSTTGQTQNQQQVQTRQPTSKLVQTLASSGIKKEQTRPLAQTLSTPDIIARLGGGDMTKGSCSSVAFAYAGNRAGIDVLDFRGGSSQQFFARQRNIDAIANLSGVNGIIVQEKNDFKAAHELIKHVVQGKEYYMATGKHAAIIRDAGPGIGLQYLELQTETMNGYHPLTDKVLKVRFGCQKQHTSYGQAYAVNNTLIDIDNLRGNVDFEEALTYINTSNNNQQKGSAGRAK